MNDSVSLLFPLNSKYAIKICQKVNTVLLIKKWGWSYYPCQWFLRKILFRWSFRTIWWI